MPNSQTVFTLSLNDNSIFSVALGPNHLLSSFSFRAQIQSTTYPFLLLLTTLVHVTNIFCYYCNNFSFWNVNQVMHFAQNLPVALSLLSYISLYLYVHMYTCIDTRVSYWLWECWLLSVPYLLMGLCVNYSFVSNFLPWIIIWWASSLPSCFCSNVNFIKEAFFNHLK